MSKLAQSQAAVVHAHGMHPEWRINKERFPSEGSPADQLAFAVQYAILAPSSHNTQPWLFEIDGQTVRLFADRSRRLPVADPNDRELTISCGAALFALRIAMRRFGLDDLVALRPDPANPDLLATVTISGHHKPGDDDVLLFKQIEHRRTNRGPYDSTPVPDTTVSKFARDAQTESAFVYAVTDRPSRHAVANLVADADRRQLHDEHYRRELASWLRPNLGTHTDGIPSYALGHCSKLWDFLSKFEPAIVRTFDLGKGTAAHDAELTDASPLLIGVCTIADTPLDWLHAGQTLMRLALRANAAGLACGYLNQPIQVPSIRTRLQRVINATPHVPQVLMRIGHGKPVEATPRRPATQVIRFAGTL